MLSILADLYALAQYNKHKIEKYLKSSSLSSLNHVILGGCALCFELKQISL